MLRVCYFLYFIIKTQKIQEFVRAVKKSIFCKNLSHELANLCLLNPTNELNLFTNPTQELTLLTLLNLLTNPTNVINLLNLLNL